MAIYSDNTQETWYFSESKTIDVHCRGAKMSFPIFSDMLFWETCAKNVKYYKLYRNKKEKSRVTDLLKEIQGLNMQYDVV